VSSTDDDGDAASERARAHGVDGDGAEPTYERGDDDDGAERPLPLTDDDDGAEPTYAS
jgi:hypothetical protein